MGDFFFGVVFVTLAAFSVGFFGVQSEPKNLFAPSQAVVMLFSASSPLWTSLAWISTSGSVRLSFTARVWIVSFSVPLNVEFLSDRPWAPSKMVFHVLGSVTFFCSVGPTLKALWYIARTLRTISWRVLPSPKMSPGSYGKAASTTSGMMPTHVDSFRFTGVVVIFPKSLVFGSPSSSSSVGGALVTALATDLVLAFLVGGVGAPVPGVGVIDPVLSFTIVAGLDTFLRGFPWVFVLVVCDLFSYSGALGFD